MMRLLLVLLALLRPASALWPLPQHLEQQHTAVRLAANLSIHLPGDHPAPPDIHQAIAATLALIRNDRHQPMAVDRGDALYHALAQPTHAHQLSLLTIHLAPPPALPTACPQQQPAAAADLLCAHPFTNASYPPPAHAAPSILAEMQQPLQTRSEAYELTIHRPGQHAQEEYAAVLSASSALGVLRGLQTFAQLVYTLTPPHPHDPSAPRKQQPLGGGAPGQPAGGAPIRFLYGPLLIKDRPAFPYRGLLLDTSRNFYSLASIRKTIETMSWAKLNLLHWHIVDAQSWPLHLPAHPQLSRHGAYAAHQTYSLEDLKELARFANARGVEILLEVDTPGHTAVVGEAYPDLVACKDKTPWSNYAAEPPAGQLRIADERALALVNEIFATLTTQVPGTLFSSGGDEVNKRCYEEDGPTQTRLRQQNQTLSQALASFVQATHATIRRAGKVPVVWEELVLDEAIPLPVDHTLVAVWRNSSMVEKVVQKGYSIIHGASDYSYLDCGLGGWLGNSVNGTSWCDPYKTWQKIYSFDPYKNVAPAQHHQVLGGQALLWSEQTDEQNMDAIIWPRALATAEVYWTGNTGRARSVTEALPRMHDMRYRIVQRGVRAAPLQPHWCAVRPGLCDLPAGTQEN
ncbi:hypothetical protein PTTG_09171 [Puccinia triticina 1-1 BBBD Race 1]|uniref:Beta-hexosaminidase n=3 Tax=Puccinia triticina TaxID=208348 RepID=A0A180H2V7_PUCT1|nr:hypothetical protein PTTG_09171 [Puccinia triticina 1-1 BBBD Race 1]